MSGCNIYLIPSTLVCILFSTCYYTGPFAPVVAPVVTVAAAAVCVTAGTAGVIAQQFIEPGELNEDQKKINDEYMNLNSRCERTLQDATEVTRVTHTQLEELRQIAKEFKQLVEQ